MHTPSLHIVPESHGLPTPGGLAHTLLMQENPDAHRSKESQTEPPGTRKAQIAVPFSGEGLQYAPLSQVPAQG